MPPVMSCRAQNRKVADLGTVALASTLTELLRTDRDGAMRVVAEVLEAQEARKERVDDVEELIPWFRATLAFEGVESFAAVFLDVQGRVLAREHFSYGSVSRTTLYPRQLFAAAFAAGATSVVLAHNHPGGTLVPSAGDRELTRRIAELGEALEVRLSDHIIVTTTGHFSFRRCGLL